MGGGDGIIYSAVL